MNTSPNARERPKSGKGKFWITLIATIFLVAAVLVVASPWWHDKYFGMAQNENAAVGSLRKINTLESQYAAGHANKGFTCELSLLGPKDKTGDPFDPTAALLSGEWSGYKFAVLGCAGEANGMVTRYRAIAVPSTRGVTGVRAFCTDESGKIFYDHNASASQCLALRQVLPD